MYHSHSLSLSFLRMSVSGECRLVVDNLESHYDLKGCLLLSWLHKASSSIQRHPTHTLSLSFSFFSLSFLLPLADPLLQQK